MNNYLALTILLLSTNFLWAAWPQGEPRRNHHNDFRRPRPCVTYMDRTELFRRIAEGKVDKIAVYPDLTPECAYVNPAYIQWLLQYQEFCSIELRHGNVIIKLY